MGHQIQVVFFYDRDRIARFIGDLRHIPRDGHFGGYAGVPQRILFPRDTSLFCRGPLHPVKILVSARPEPSLEFIWPCDSFEQNLADGQRPLAGFCWLLL